MGLVSTWLNGIGLSSAVPTFQAAGIVTPAALAELDVAHFEALGISDPDDRRKLFYLVQRIKMAVNKDKRQEGTVEDQVDAVILGTQSMSEPEEEPVMNEKVEKIPTPRASVNSPSLSRKKVGAQPTTALPSTPRRSKRLASKKEDRDPNDGTNDETDEKVSKKKEKSTSPSKKKKEKSTSPEKEKSPSKKKEKSPSKKKEKSSSEKLTSPSKKKEKSSKKEKSASPSKKKEKTTSPQKTVAEAKVPKLASPSTSRKKDTSIIKPKELDVTNEDEDYGASSERDSPVKKLPSSARSTGSSSRAKAVFNLQDDDDKTALSFGSTRSLSTRKSGLKMPTTIIPTEGESSLRTISKIPQTPTSKSQASISNRRPESKLQNPGKSMRTGKSLSVIPSETAAPMSPLDDLPPPRERSDKRLSMIAMRSNSERRRRSSSSSRGSESFDVSFQLSENELDSDSNSEYEGVRKIPVLSSSRRQTMASFEIPSRSSKTSFRPLSSNSSHKSASSNSSRRRKSEGVFKSSISPKGENVKASGKAVPFVHGGTQSESWATQVEYLREDNTAEHDLFRDEGDQQLYEYDMSIRVIVRKRPVSKVEASTSGGVDVIHPLDYGEYGRILVYQPKTRVDLTKEIETIPFAFDNVYDESSTNIQIYQRSLRNLIKPFFRGQWSTVFAYGQTGSGKTYTMMGSNMTGINAGTATNDQANLGLYYLAALDIFDMVERPEYRHLSVQVSLFEIYGGKLFDLLNSRKPIKCLEDSKGKVCFPGLTEHPVEGPDDLMELIEAGAGNRSTGTTSRNADSSRSHAVLQLKLRKDIGRRKNIEHGRLNFIDLAGSERGADTSSSSRATRLEGAEINTSLLALKEVIRALATGGSMTHIPFRGSKLTQVLKDSFVGENSRCCMVACISPDIGNCEQTLNTLRYADRVKERDPESGALSNGYEQPTKLNALNLISHENEVEQMEDDNIYAEEGEESDPSMTEDQLDDSMALQELLSTSCVEPEPPTMIREPLSPIQSTNKYQAGENLVSEHRSVMSKMLAMVKKEMTLVNTADADRDGLDEYLVQLEEMQNTQLDLISKLRSSLEEYASACEVPRSESPIGDSNAHVESDDDSFEDLRD